MGIIVETVNNLQKISVQMIVFITCVIEDNNKSVKRLIILFMI